ncbi:MAG: rod shape-determining protein MreD [Pseudomonadota bacterium]
MNSAASARSAIWRIAGSLIVALALTVVPLPDFLRAARPDWVALVVIYWSVFAPQRLPFWAIALVGLALDALYGTLLGLHALALVVMAFPALRLHLQLRVFSWAQLAAAAVLLVIVYEFVLFWSNGIAGLSTRGVDYWLPVVTSAVAWPFVLYILDAVIARDRP